MPCQVFHVGYVIFSTLIQVVYFAWHYSERYSVRDAGRFGPNLTQPNLTNLT